MGKICAITAGGPCIEKESIQWKGGVGRGISLKSTSSAARTMGAAYRPKKNHPSDGPHRSFRADRLIVCILEIYLGKFRMQYIIHCSHQGALRGQKNGKAAHLFHIGRARFLTLYPNTDSWCLLRLHYRVSHQLGDSLWFPQIWVFWHATLPILPHSHQPRQYQAD